MTTRRPLVIQDGFVSELFPGDQAIAGYSPTEVIAGSGLGGGGAVSTDPSVYVQLAANASGLIITPSGLSTDGVAIARSNTALASGNASVIYAQTALASGNAALFTATSALASGNAALARVPTLGVGEGTQALLTTASVVGSGQPVGFDDAGKIQVIRKNTVVTNNPMTFGPKVNYNSALTVYPSTAVNTNPNSTEFVHIYIDAVSSQYYPKVICGNVVNSSGVYGTPVVLQSNNGGSGPTPTIVYSREKERYIVLYNWYDGASTYYMRTRTVAVSGNQLFAGSPVDLQSSAANLFYYSTVSYDPDAQKPVYIWGNPNSSWNILLRTGTVTGNSISLGTQVNTATYITSTSPSATYTKNGNTVVVYRDNSGYGNSSIARPSGTTIDLSTNVIWRSADVTYPAVSYDSSRDKLVVSFNNTATTKGSALVGTVSGFTINYSTTLTTFAPSGCAYISSAYDEAATSVVIATSDTGHSSYGTSYVATVSGDVVNFASTPAIYTPNIVYYNDVKYHPGVNKCIFTHRNGGDNYGVSYISTPLNAFTYYPTISGLSNFVGVSRTTTTSGNSCLVDLVGSLTPVEADNLVPSTYYYVDPTASGFTTSSTQPITYNSTLPWTYVARAASSSGLYLLKGL